MNRCRGFQRTCGCRWPELCVPHQTGTGVLRSPPAWKRSGPCRCCLLPRFHSHCSSWTAGKSSARNREGWSELVLVYIRAYMHINLRNYMCVCVYPKLLQALACPAVIDGHSAVFAPRDDVLVVCSEAHHSVTMEAEAFHQGFSSCSQNYVINNLRD